MVQIWVEQGGEGYKPPELASRCTAADPPPAISCLGTHLHQRHTGVCIAGRFATLPISRRHLGLQSDHVAQTLDSSEITFSPPWEGEKTYTRNSPSLPIRSNRSNTCLSRTVFVGISYRNHIRDLTQTN